jgi:hypothetical protein
MLRSLSRWIGLVACVSAACAGHHEPSPSPSAEAELDASAVRPALDSGDVAPPDALADSAVPFDDAGVEPMTFAAVRGQLCDNRELIGVVLVIKDAPPYTDFIARAVVMQQRLPIVPELSIARGACGFYAVPIPPMCGDGCQEPGLACVGDGVCEPWPPKFSTDARLTLSNGSASQTMNGLGETQLVELEGALSVQLEFGRYVVTLDATAIPEPIEGLEVVRNGPSNVPESIDIRWPAPVDGHVYAYALLPSPYPLVRYAECVVDGAALEMPIEQDVLAPFVGRGFEFQGVDHVYLAAATTPAGCLDIRFIYRYWHHRQW